MVSWCVCIGIVLQQDYMSESLQVVEMDRLNGRQYPSQFESHAYPSVTISKSNPVQGFFHAYVTSSSKIPECNISCLVRATSTTYVSISNRVYIYYSQMKNSLTNKMCLSIQVFVSDETIYVDERCILMQSYLNNESEY